MGLRGLLTGARAKQGRGNKQDAVLDPFEGIEDAVPPPEAPHYQPGTWPIDRLDVLEALWGRGNLIPGSHDFVAGLMNVCALSSAKTMLDLGAGLGGASRAMVKKFGVWLVGLDREDILASEANRRSLSRNMDKKAVFFACDPETLRLKPSAYDAILCRQVLSTVQDKENLFNQLAEALKPSAHLVIYDFVQGAAKGHAEVLKTLWATEIPKMQLQRPQQIANALKERNFLIHVAEDATAAYREMALGAWIAYCDALKPGTMKGLAAEVVLEECRRWVNRVAALDCGAVKVYRFHATNSSEKKKGSVATLSDWKY
ncbi:class I SAM-dependent methyltransferase [Oleispirillum naphthae]|uniref:class I SAM-dependent methyltransferase n=1 Tax=Oleispirillum naphthae TaxID=2838853 RepID=UPI00308255BC